jgi:hypothetical protein
MKRLIKRASSLLVLSALISSVAACGTNRNLNQEPGLNSLDQVNSLAQRPRSKSGKKWTVAIHMAADNNLYTAGLDDINEMEAGLASDDVDVIVLFDGSKTGDSKVYKITKDKNGYDKTIVSTVIDDKGALIPASHEIDSGDPKVFAKFVDWVTKNYPADNNFVAIWNHGSGIFRNAQGSFADLLAKSPNSPNKSFASDDNGGSMHLKDLNPALSLGAANLGKPIDMLGFDTCLMGHMETAYQVKGLANYLVASEELEPGDGWDYQGFLAAVSANPSMSPAEASAALVDAYGKSYAPGGSQSGSAVTLSAVDINALVNGLVPAINQFGNDLTASLSSAKPALTAVRSQTQVFYNRDAADLGDFLGKLSKDVSLSADLKTSAAKVQSELAKTVIREAHSGKPLPATKGSVAGATGLVVYFPNSSMSYNTKYDNVSEIRFAEQKEWGSFLKAFTKK